MRVRIPAERNELRSVRVGFHPRLFVQLGDERAAASRILTEDLGVLCGHLEISGEFLGHGLNVD